ncbi:TetR/AcrR family transcriptional regulator [Actinoplanes sp. NBRC 101535]|uniref:TetR/AcrR family transcriptional regulator n=1 Tax=Actinoplanes sp. NBRC 101535 TaxID=3032196 RepID=UPI0024A413BB|nr:TetR/AcrR family transcriptional regulator [Actinoplanes sp. NBRC 101535]GLY06614.1 TetR family transcriptional regulator [Actinoplanes sp. NBRC 101535]
MPRTTAKALESRQRFIDVALGLFIRHSFAGTSLQMIADELGVTKSAVHHHFRTRDDLLQAVIDPLIGQLRNAVEAAEALRGRHARAERLLIGFVDIVVNHKALMSLLSGDPGVIEMLRAHPELSALSRRQMTLFAAVEAGPAGEVKASVVTRGLAGAAANPLFGLDDQALHTHLCTVGRLTLGLPRLRPS